MNAQKPSDKPTLSLMRHAIEWPTWLALASFWLVWWLCVANPYHWSGWVVYPLLTINLAWYMSLQHELVHLHPTISPTMNRLLGIWPVAVWYPYDLYRDSHLAHHRDALLTLPYHDPESNYVYTDVWAKMGTIARWGKLANRTVVGRVVLGPGFAIGALIGQIGHDIVHHNWAGIRMWTTHLALCVALFAWLSWWGTVSLLGYLIASYFCFGIAMIRSLYEHRPASSPHARIVLNEANWFWRWLYLNNNYHLVHHQYPRLAWYLIPRVYRAHQAIFQAQNEGFQLPGYGGLFRRHLFRPIDSAQVERGYF